MLIFEVENTEKVDTGKLGALAQFLSGIADDNNSKKQISTKAFIELAQSLGVNVSDGPQGNLAQLITQEPISNILMPIDPTNPEVINFVGSQEAGEEPMDPADSGQLVAAKANAAAKKNIGKSLT
mgnify:CR=1 FL=1|jgi:hypothetical protein